MRGETMGLKPNTPRNLRILKMTDEVIEASVLQSMADLIDQVEIYQRILKNDGETEVIDPQVVEMCLATHFTLSMDLLKTKLAYQGMYDEQKQILRDTKDDYQEIWDSSYNSVRRELEKDSKISAGKFPNAGDIQSKTRDDFKKVLKPSKRKVYEAEDLLEELRRKRNTVEAIEKAWSYRANTLGNLKQTIANQMR